MPAATTHGDHLILGNLQVMGSMPAAARTALTQESYSQQEIDFRKLGIWDSAIFAPIATPASDDLGLGIGAFATGVPYVSAGDVKTLTGTRYARFITQIPREYVAAQPIKFTANAGMITTVAGTSCTLDIEVYKLGSNALITGAELVAAAPVTMNSLTFADLDFALTAAGLSPGNWLDCRLVVSYVDAATGTAVIPAIATLVLACATKG